jgi:hypothetical protein
MKDETDKPVYKVAYLQFQVSILKVDVVNDILILTGKYSSSKVNTWNGKSCASMDIIGNCIEVNKALEVMSAFPVMDSVPADVLFLPYSTSLMDHSENRGGKSERVKFMSTLHHSSGPSANEVSISSKKKLSMFVFFLLQRCSLTLVMASGRGKTATMAEVSNCEYLVKFSLKAAETSTKSGLFAHFAKQFNGLITWNTIIKISIVIIQQQKWLDAMKVG